MTLESWWQHHKHYPGVIIIIIIIIIIMNTFIRQKAEETDRQAGR